jgi:hypothetical protein
LDKTPAVRFDAFSERVVPEDAVLERDDHVRAGVAVWRREIRRGIGRRSAGTRGAGAVVATGIDGCPPALAARRVLRRPTPAGPRRTARSGAARCTARPRASRGTSRVGHATSIALDPAAPAASDGDPTTLPPEPALRCAAARGGRGDELPQPASQITRTIDREALLNS